MAPTNSDFMALASRTSSSRRALRSTMVACCAMPDRNSTACSRSGAGRLPKPTARKPASTRSWERGRGARLGAQALPALLEPLRQARERGVLALQVRAVEEALLREEEE